MLKKISIILIIILALISVFFWIKKTTVAKPNTSTKPAAQASQSNESPKIVSTKPDPLDKTILSSTQEIEITFNRPLENVGEFKIRIEPKVDFKLELSQDRKTGKIKPTNPYELGTTYTVFIGSDTKFDGVGAWGQTKTFQFKTIKYSGV